jgi:hypothetical protein
MRAVKQTSRPVDMATVVMDGIDWSDKDLCDAYIEYAEYMDGTEVSEEDLETLNDDGDLVFKLAEESLHR